MPAPDYPGLFDASPNPYLVLDRRLHIVTANRAYLAATGRRLEDLVGRWAWDAFPTDPDTLRVAVESFERVIATGQPDTLALLRFDIPRPDSAGGGMEERYWSITASPVFDAAGEVVQILQHPIDVTELQRLRMAAAAAASAGDASGRPPEADAAPLSDQRRILDRADALQQANWSLHAERERLRTMFEQAPGFMVMFRGPDHVFELANAAYRDIVGAHREMLGLPLRQAQPEVVDQPFPALLDRVWASGVPFVGRGMPVRLARTPDSPPEERVVDFVYQPLTDARGEIYGIFAQGHDVTEQHRALEALQSADRRKDEFLAMLAHELRNPLAPLTNALRLIERTEPLTERGRAALAVVERQRAQLARLVDDLLEVSRITSGKIALKPESMDLTATVPAVVESLAPTLQWRGHRLELAQPDEPVRIVADAGRIVQVLENLLRNAIKYTPDGGRIRLELEPQPDGHWVEIRVIDNGVGIEPSQIGKLFQLFSQLDATLDRSAGGLGLGLALVKRLVELHGGSVRAESAGRGQGATFAIRLPRKHGDTTGASTGS